MIESLRDKVAKYVKHKPACIQFAKDEVWEKAISIEPGDPTAESRIQHFLKNGEFHTVSMEAMFEEKDLHYVFGLECTPRADKPYAEILRIFLKETQQFKNFITFMENLESGITGDSYFLEGEPDKIRIGVVNHWQSVGPLFVWEKGMSKKLSLRELEDKLASRPDVFETNLNYQGMSFTFNIDGNPPGLCHWIKSPCSFPRGDIWKLDPDMVTKYLQEWGNLAIQAD